jgi:hypothetical protein
MNTFYSIVYALITPQTGEKISLGLLLSDDEKSIFRFSKAKLSVVHSLVGDEQSRFIADYIHSLDRQCNAKDSCRPEIDLDFADAAKSLVSERYIDYLSVYNQNIITFSKPVVIDMEISPASMDILFPKLINEKQPIYQLQIHHEHKLSDVRNSFVHVVSNHFSIDREITKTEFPGLIMPVKIDLFGKNERTVFAKFFDFERKTDHIKNSFFDLDQMLEVLDKPKAFIISAEPEAEKYAVQHQAWESIRNIKKVDYVDCSEVKKIQEYAVEHGVIPA